MRIFITNYCMDMFTSQDEENHDKSLARFESMLKTNKVFFFDSEEFEDIVLHYLDSGKLPMAKKALKLALDQHPTSTGLKLVQVEIWLFDDQLDAAEKLLNELQQLEPFNDEVYIQRANLHSKRDEHELAVASLQQALVYTEDPADVHNLLGMEYLFMDEMESAKKHFIACLEADIEDQSALYNVVYCYEFLDQIEGAIAFLQHYIDRQPYSEIAWHQLGRLQYQLGAYEAAVQSFELATHIDESFIGAYMELAKALEKLKRYSEAVQYYLETIQLGDPTSYALLRLGKCFEKSGHLAEALSYYQRTVHEDPLLDKGWMAITNYYWKQNEPHKALMYISKAIGIDPQNIGYWRRFAQIHQALQQYEEAEEGLRKAVELGDYNVKTWVMWARQLMHMGEYQQAVSVLVQAMDYFPDQARINFYLSGLYFTLNESEKGVFYLYQGMQLRKNPRKIFEAHFPVLWASEGLQQWVARFKSGGHA